MEQRIGPSSQPLEGAGFDPAFIPGLTAPTKPDPDAAQAPEDEAEPTEQPSPTTPAPRQATEDTEETTPEPSDAPESPDAPEPSAADASEDPVFEAADRRARIVADRSGVRLSLDEESCEFRWDEIGAVETESPRFGKRFTITVHTPDRRWYPIEIEATARSRFKEWEAQLDEVLDAYFQD